MNTWLIVINSALTPYMLQSAANSTSATELVRPFLSDHETVHAVVLTIGLNLTTRAPAAFKNHAPPVQANLRLN